MADKPTPGSRNLTKPVMSHDTATQPTEQKLHTSTERNEVTIQDSKSS